MLLDLGFQKASEHKTVHLRKTSVENSLSLVDESRHRHDTPRTHRYTLSFARAVLPGVRASAKAGWLREDAGRRSMGDRWAHGESWGLQRRMAL